MQKFPEAIADCETALLLNPENTKAFVHKGRALVAQKQYEQAILTYSEIIKHNPKQTKIAQGKGFHKLILNESLESERPIASC